MYKCIFTIPKARGSVVRTTIQIAYCVSTSRKARTCLAIPKQT